MREIELTKGQVAVVDDADYELVSRYKWHASWCRKARTFYARTNVGVRPHRKQLLMHWLILGVSPELFVDHVNHNGLDNRRENIRACTRAQNAQNARKRRGASSQFKGVHYEHGWVARLRVDGALVRLGKYSSELEAAAAYDREARKRFGEFALTNGVAA